MYNKPDLPSGQQPPPAQSGLQSMDNTFVSDSNASVASVLSNATFPGLVENAEANQLLRAWIASHPAAPIPSELMSRMPGSKPGSIHASMPQPIAPGQVAPGSLPLDPPPNLFRMEHKPNSIPQQYAFASGSAAVPHKPDNSTDPITGERNLCTFFMRTGTCAYGDRCKFKHPKDRPPPQMNSRGYPLRPGEEDCAHYMKKGWCAFGLTCKFDHPELTTAPVTIQLPYNPIAPAAPMPSQPTYIMQYNTGMQGYTMPLVYLPTAGSAQPHMVQQMAPMRQLPSTYQAAAMPSAPPGGVGMGMGGGYYAQPGYGMTAAPAGFSASDMMPSSAHHDLSLQFSSLGLNGR